MGITIRLINNADIVKREMEKSVYAALESVGQQAETYAKQNLNAAGRVDTGRLMNDITHEVRLHEDAVYIGTNVKYSPYVEFGTGIYGDKPTGGSGGKTWWVYVAGDDTRGFFAKAKSFIKGALGIRGKRYTYEEARQVVAILRSKGLDAHMTQGMKPTHFLRNAAANHTDEYKKIVEAQLKKG